MLMRLPHLQAYYEAVILLAQCHGKSVAIIPRVESFIGAAEAIEKEHDSIYGHKADRYNDRTKALAVLKVCESVSHWHRS